MLFHVSITSRAKFRPDLREQYVAMEIENETVVHIVRLRIKSMSATSGPPIGPVLGQYATPISKFCTESNERSKIFCVGVEVFVTIFHFADGTYAFDMSTPVSSICFKRAAGRTRGHGKQWELQGGVITPFMIYEAVSYRISHCGETVDHARSMFKAVLNGLGTVQSMGPNVFMDK